MRFSLHPLQAAVAACLIFSTAAPLFARTKVPPRVPSIRPVEIESALVSAGKFLMSKQSPDGAWRSEVYEALKGGSALTPPSATVLYFLEDRLEGAREAYRKGSQYLLGWVGSDGKIIPMKNGMDYPVYTAAAASWVMVLEPRGSRYQQAQKAWVNYLLEHRLNSKLGWQPGDLDYGGWGESLQLPKKGSGGNLSANISTTLFGINALRLDDLPPTDPVFGEILLFVKRCQNFAENPEESDLRFNDGGFFFCPSDAARNKAGPAGVDSQGRQRFASYGSATCDGLRALIRCGVPMNDPRAMAARDWLGAHFSVTFNPGNFAPDRQVLRDAYYYYYCWSLAHACMAMNASEIDTPKGKVKWAEALSMELVHRQRSDGSWFNRYNDDMEDDPLVATPLAAAALFISESFLEKNPFGSPKHP